MSRPLGWMAVAITLAAVEGVRAAVVAIHSHRRFEHVRLER